MRQLAFALARAEALATCLRDNQRMVTFGDMNSPFDPPNTIDKDFPGRVLRPPASEGAYFGAAAGLAIAGWRVFCDSGNSGFMLSGWDQVVNEAPCFRYMSGGQVTVPIVIRIVSGLRGGGGAQHSQDPERWLMSVPGLKVIKPSTPYDVKGLFLAALEDDNPVVFVDHGKLAHITGDVPEEPYRIPLGQAAVRREGTDVTLAGIGWIMTRVVKAAEALAEDGIEADVIDLRCLKPLDADAVAASVGKTGRLVVVDESPTAAGFAAEVAAIAAERCGGQLKAPVQRLCMPDAPVPYSPPLEEAMLPSVAGIVAAARKAVRGK